MIPPVRIAVLTLLLVATALPAQSNPWDHPGAEITELLGNTVPLSVSYDNEAGEAVVLRDVIEGPTILSLIYFNCVGTCTPMISSMAAVLDRSDLVAGDDYRLVTLSINELDTPEMAEEKKANYLKTMENPVPDVHWTWLTAPALSIRKLTWSIGFQFHALSNTTFAHPAGLFFLNGEGKLVRVLHGITFTERDIRLALLEASDPATLSLWERAQLTMTRYDRDSATYQVRWGRIGLVALLAFGTLLVALLASRVRRRRILLGFDIARY